MRNIQSGFTLIELIMVIVILGILAVTAIPKYIDMEAEAQQAAVDGVAGSLASAAAINYAGCSAGSTCTTVDNCDDLDAVLAGGLPSGYTNPALGTAVTTNGNSLGCSVNKVVGSTTYTASYTGIAAGN